MAVSTKVLQSKLWLAHIHALQVLYALRHLTTQNPFKEVTTMPTDGPYVVLTH